MESDTIKTLEMESCFAMSLLLSVCAFVIETQNVVNTAMKNVLNVIVVYRDLLMVYFVKYGNDTFKFLFIFEFDAYLAASFVGTCELYRCLEKMG